jgi:hypothetical protein
MRHPIANVSSGSAMLAGLPSNVHVSRAHRDRIP